MRIGSKSQNEFFLSLNTKNEIIQKKFLEKISDATKTINVKVMLGDSTVKEVSTFDSKNIEIFFNKISTILDNWTSDGISYSYNDDTRRIFVKYQITENDIIISLHVSVQFHVLLYYKPEQEVLTIQKELAKIIDTTSKSDRDYSSKGNEIILKKLQELGYENVNEQNLFELFYNDESLSKMLSEKIENSQSAQTVELNNRKKDLFNKLDSLLLETFQTSQILIDEERLVNGEEGCLCNIDLERFEDDSKHGLFDLDSIDDILQNKITNRINQILTSMEN